jgi:hypothetical protein
MLSPCSGETKYRNGIKLLTIVLISEIMKFYKKYTTWQILGISKNATLLVPLLHISQELKTNVLLCPPL